MTITSRKDSVSCKMSVQSVISHSTKYQLLQWFRAKLWNRLPF